MIPLSIDKSLNPLISVLSSDTISGNPPHRLKRK